MTEPYEQALPLSVITFQPLFNFVKIVVTVV